MFEKKKIKQEGFQKFSQMFDAINHQSNEKLSGL